MRKDAPSTTSVSRDDLTEVIGCIGYDFKDLALLRAALTHRTYARSFPDEGVDYERLEFLGDAVLDLACADLLWRKYPHDSEGQLSQKRAKVVCMPQVAKAARHWQLQRFIKTAKPLMPGAVHITPSILADVFEAVLGALYLDGGFAAALQVARPVLLQLLEHDKDTQDAKSALQEFCHAHQLKAPVYGVVDCLGPAHQRVFRCSVVAADGVQAQGEGPSKRVAEQAAAKAALQYLTQATPHKEPKLP